jgi:hypothetical protein
LYISLVHIIVQNQLSWKKKFLIEIFLTVRLLFSYKLYNQDNKKPNLMSSHQKSYGCHHIFDHPYGRSVTQSIAACLQYEVRITLPSIDFGNQNHNGDVIDREESVLRHSVFRFHLSFKFFLRWVILELVNVVCSSNRSGGKCSLQFQS